MMRKHSVRFRRLGTLIALTVVGIHATGASQKNVLILSSEDTFRPAFLTYTLSVRAGMIEGSTNHVEFFTETLDESRFPEAQYGKNRLDYFRWKYGERHFDVIIAGPTPALDFLIAHRDELFPGSPVIFASADENLVRQRKLPPGFTGLPMRLDLPATLDLALQLQPDTREVVVVVGASDYDKSWEAIARAALAPFEKRVRFRYLSNLAVPAMLAEATRLPAHTVLLYLSVMKDAAGADWQGREVCKQIAAVANAPVYCPYETGIGLGVVGGNVAHAQADGRNVATLALRVLGGEDASSIPVQKSAPSFDTVDWRAMKRWGLSESRLRPGSDVRFREQSFWEEYKWQLIGIHGLALAEALLIVALVRSRRRLQMTQSRLSESQERLSLATSSVMVGVWSWSVKKGTIEATEEFRELFGWQPDEPLDYEKFLERLRVEDRAKLKESMEEAIKRKSIFDTECRIVLAEEQVCWIAVRGQCHYANGSPTNVVGVAIDVTERRLAEIAAERHRAELSHMSRVSAMGQLATSLAHELTQPLAAILRNAEAAELFLRSPHPDLEELRHIIADIRQDDQRACGVIDRLRVLLKGREVEMQSLDATTLAEGVLFLVRSDAFSRRVAMEFEATPNLPPVRGDLVQLQQVLLNLIVNAMDAVGGNAADKRKVKVQVGQNGDGFVALSVSDSGHGIPGAQLGQVFEPFFTTKPQGMGMGLSISRTIVEAHGGGIWAMNNQEGGATFCFTVPVANKKMEREVPTEKPGLYASATS